jgi:hypothetical protein
MVLITDGAETCCTCFPRKDPTSSLYAVLDVLRNECDLLSLVRLGCSSKLGRSLVTAVVHNNLQDTIWRALKDAAASNSQIKHVRVLQWLLAAASQHEQQQQHMQQQHSGLARKLDAGSLSLVEHVPAAAAEALVAAGLLVNKQQLIAAARARVPGLEVWLQAHYALDMPNGLLPGWVSIMRHAACSNNTEVRMKPYTRTGLWAAVPLHIKARTPTACVQPAVCVQQPQPLCMCIRPDRNAHTCSLRAEKVTGDGNGWATASQFLPGIQICLVTTLIVCFVCFAAGSTLQLLPARTAAAAVHARPTRQASLSLQHADITSSRCPHSTAAVIARAGIAAAAAFMPITAGPAAGAAAALNCAATAAL